MLFDTHLHLIYKDRLSYPWLADFAVLDRDNPLEDYMRSAARLGISGCFHMEVDVAEAQIEKEAEVISELFDLPGSPLRGIISSCRPERGDFAAFLDRARDNPGIKGFRRVLHVAPDETSTTIHFRDNVKRLAGTGLTFDLCVLPRQFALAQELVDHCPDVSFVLDHCGVPDIAGGEFAAWRTGIRALAERPNLHAKISGIIAYGDPDNWTIGDLRPYFEETVAAFGTDRILWGSDSPVCNLGGGLECWVAATYALTDGWSGDERAALFHATACKLWQLEAMEATSAPAAGHTK